LTCREGHELSRRPANKNSPDFPMGPFWRYSVDGLPRFCSVSSKRTGRPVFPSGVPLLDRVCSRLGGPRHRRGTATTSASPAQFCCSMAMFETMRDPRALFGLASFVRSTDVGLPSQRAASHRNHLALNSTADGPGGPASMGSLRFRSEIGLPY